MREGEVSCETTEECLNKVKSGASTELVKQIQIKKDEFKRANSILVSFSLIPIEYKVDFYNFSHLKVWITGTNQIKKITNLSIICNFNGISQNLQYNSHVTLFDNLELNNFQGELFDKFDGCVLSSGLIQINEVKGWTWPPGAYFKVSFERDFKIIPYLRWTSKLLIILQSFIVILLAIPILKQGGLYIKKGIKYFFIE